MHVLGEVAERFLDMSIIYDHNTDFVIHDISFQLKSKGRNLKGAHAKMCEHAIYRNCNFCHKENVRTSNNIMIWKV